MNCPTCSKTSLQPRTRLGLTLHICTACQGVWLARETIEALGQTTGLFLKERSTATIGVGTGLRRPLWKELFDAEE